MSLFATHPTMVPAIVTESIVQLGACGRGLPGTERKRNSEQGPR
jgi:hypothetical protein